MKKHKTVQGRFNEVQKRLVTETFKRHQRTKLWNWDYLQHPEAK